MRAINRTCSDNVMRILQSTKTITCINGVGSYVESGGCDLWENEEFYRIEREYDKSPEEMLSAGVYNTKQERFFDFYKKEILNQIVKPCDAYPALAALQRMGVLKTVITVNVAGMEFRNGLRNVLELNGSIYSNQCPVCKKGYTARYMRDSKSVPVCPDCKGTIRPGIRLRGERVRNDLMTEACNACASAEVLLVLGTNLNEPDVKYCTGHYMGDKMILITPEEHYLDKYADYVLYGPIGETLLNIVKNMKRR